VAGRHGFAVMSSDHVPINHPGQCAWPILFRVLTALLLIAGSPPTSVTILPVAFVVTGTGVTP